MMHPYQAYMHLEKCRIMPAIRAEYFEYLKTVPEGTKPESPLKFQSSIAKRMLKDEPKDVQDQVESFRQDPMNFMKDGELSVEDQKAVRLAE